MRDLDILTRDWFASHDLATLRGVVVGLIDASEAILPLQNPETRTAEENANIVNDSAEIAKRIHWLAKEVEQREPVDILASLDRIAILAAVARYANDGASSVVVRDWVNKHTA